MKPVAQLVLLVAATVALPGQNPSKQSQSDKNAEKILIQMEHDWSEADTKRDASALQRILSEDWVGIDFEGTVLNKAQAIEGIDSGSGSLESTVLRDMKVRIYGNTAVLTGTDTEEGQYHGKDSSGKYLWTDVFVRRNGRWQAVSSQSTKLTRETGPKLFAAARLPRARHFPIR
jgi:ketosteroid isomerase-like protein